MYQNICTHGTKPIMTKGFYLNKLESLRSNDAPCLISMYSGLRWAKIFRITIAVAILDFESSPTFIFFYYASTPATISAKTNSCEYAQPVKLIIYQYLKQAYKETQEHINVSKSLQPLIK